MLLSPEEQESGGNGEDGNKAGFGRYVGVKGAKGIPR